MSDTFSRFCDSFYFGNPRRYKHNIKCLGAMSGPAKRISGSVTVAGGRGESLGGQRLGRQAWQDIRRACRLAGESDRVRSVDIRGVHISFFPKAPSCQNGIGAPSPPVQPVPSATTPPAQDRPSSTPNSRQRRSAKRLEKYNADKKAKAAAAGSPSAAASHRAEAPALATSRPVEIDASMDVEAPATDTGASPSGSAAAEREVVRQWQARGPQQHQAAANMPGACGGGSA